MSSNPTPMLTLEQAADLLHVSTRTIRRFIKAQDLPAHKIGRQWRIARRDLEEHLRRHRRGGVIDVL